jgi:hypothetical protein
MRVSSNPFTIPTRLTPRFGENRLPAEYSHRHTHHYTSLEGVRKDVHFRTQKPLSQAELRMIEGELGRFLEEMSRIIPWKL